jgi:hypothetical protein
MEQRLEEFSPRRVVIGAGILIVAGVVFELAVRRSLAGALSLTAAGLVAIINFRLLESLLGRVIQPEGPRFDRGSLLRMFGRFVALGLLLFAIVWVPGMDGVAVALGVSTVVVSLLVEAFRWASIGGG